ncbi:NAD(P)H-dependent flavin oxidoreductase [Neisseria yangbaofengii]|uniref:NAD(P)H-dependent flavin oxidoreductase n=1 Tax=Neisseria yangbaofengii TaxID=2709396 RepID=UPI0013EA5BCD|nr:nitronate monooxygenase [Neisseria yangbaofengii]
MPNRLTQLLGCRLPVIQAPMAGVQNSRLAIAACRSGALGSLPAAMLSPDQLRAEIEAIRAATNAPFNVNFFAHRQPEADAGKMQQWLATLAPYYRELGIDADNIAQGGGRQPFGAAQADIITELKPPVVSFHFGLPEADLLQQVKQSGAKILCSATTVDEARWLVEHGANAVIAQGLEAGGHRSMFRSKVHEQVGTFALLPQIRAAVDVPVIAAGGISNAATARAAQTLGADGIQIGTALLLADEADTSAAHRTALQSPRAETTALTNLFSGGLARGIVNRFMRENGCIHPVAPPFPLAQSASAPLRSAAEKQGSDEFSPLWAGQNAPLARNGSTAEIIAEITGGFMA